MMRKRPCLMQVVPDVKVNPDLAEVFAPQWRDRRACHLTPPRTRNYFARSL